MASPSMASPSMVSLYHKPLVTKLNMCKFYAWEFHVVLSQEPNISVHVLIVQELNQSPDVNIMNLDLITAKCIWKLYLLYSV